MLYSNESIYSNESLYSNKSLYSNESTNSIDYFQDDEEISFNAAQLTTSVFEFIESNVVSFLKKPF